MPFLLCMFKFKRVSTCEYKNCGQKIDHNFLFCIIIDELTWGLCGVLVCTNIYLAKSQQNSASVR
jgi:hypothetical protein